MIATCPGCGERFEVPGTMGSRRRYCEVCKVKVRVCQTEGCGKPVFGRGWCRNCYYEHVERGRRGHNRAGSEAERVIHQDIWADRYGEPRWTEDRIVAAIQAWFRRTGRPPTVDQWRKRATRGPQRKIGRRGSKRPSVYQVVEVFGSWSAAIQAAGFRARPPGWSNAHRTKVERTHCHAGHEYTPENTAYTKDGARRCRECGKLTSRRQRRREKARRLAAKESAGDPR